MADGAFASTPSDGAIGSTWNLFLVVFASLGFMIV
jgi:hypothetical protein